MKKSKSVPKLPLLFPKSKMNKEYAKKWLEDQKIEREVRRSKSPEK